MGKQSKKINNFCWIFNTQTVTEPRFQLWTASNNRQTDDTSVRSLIETFCFCRKTIIGFDRIVLVSTFQVVYVFDWIACETDRSETIELSLFVSFWQKGHRSKAIRMVAKLKTLKDLDFSLSRRSSAYVEADCEAFIDIPIIIYHSANNELTTCQGCFPFLEGKCSLFSLHNYALECHTFICHDLSHGEHEWPRAVLRSVLISSRQLENNRPSAWGLTQTLQLLFCSKLQHNA